MLLFWNVGCASKSTHEEPAAVALTPPKMSALLADLRARAYQHVVAQEFEKAIATYSQARKAAQSEGNQPLAVQFLVNIAGCYQSLGSYREAMQSYQEAVQDARDKRLVQLENTTALNMASLMLELGENQSAADLIARYPLDGSTILPSVRLLGFIIQMNVFTRLKQPDQAKLAFQRALAEAERPPSAEILAATPKSQKKWAEAPAELRKAYTYAMYSQALIRMERFAEAEPYSLEAFRIRSTYQDRNRLRELLHLAMIRRSRGEFDSASQLIDTARALDGSNRTAMLVFLLDREKARLELAQGHYSASLPYLERALRQARAWRMQVLPTDSIFMSFESNLTEEIQVAFLDLLLSPSFDLAQAGVAADSFWIAEEARFASMRAAQFPASEFSKRLPAEYWTNLARFQRIQSRALAGDSSLHAEIAPLERTLNRIEMEAGLTIPHSSATGSPNVQAWIESIPQDEVLFSYYLSEPHSLAWTASRKGIHLRRIAGRKQIAALVDNFRKSIQTDAQNGNDSSGMELSRQLFGENLYLHRTTPFWTMVLDSELLSLPVAALPTGRPAAPFLVFDHSLRILPAAILISQNSTAVWTRHVEGIGDPVYNQADQRLTQLAKVSDDLLRLNRLPASTLELKRSLDVFRSQSWTSNSRTGLEANAQNLKKALESSPDILHISTHFLAQPGTAHLLNVALSPDPGGRTASVFGPLDLNTLRTSTKLVVLSGCSTSTGEVVPAIGINGLSRAFLISGVGAVLSTLWPTLDSDGPIFPVFYQHLIQQPWSPRSVAESLRAAQLAMIHQNGWVSKPAYWAAYLPISKG